MSRDAGRAAGDWNESCHHPNQSGFTGSVRAQQTENFSFLYGERNVVHRGELAITLHDMIDLDGVGSIRRNRSAQIEFGYRQLSAIRLIHMHLNLPCSGGNATHCSVVPEQSSVLQI